MKLFLFGSNLERSLHKSIETLSERKIKWSGVIIQQILFQNEAVLNKWLRTTMAPRNYPLIEQNISKQINSLRAFSIATNFHK